MVFGEVISAWVTTLVCVSPEEKDLHPIMFIWFPLLLSEQHQTTQVASGGKHATPSPKGWVLGDSPLL